MTERLRTWYQQGGDPGDKDTAWYRSREAKIDEYQKKSRQRYERQQEVQGMDQEAKDFFEVEEPKKKKRQVQVAERLMNGG